MSIADKLQTIANNLATESEAVEQQTELLQQIRTALVGKAGPGGSSGYDQGYADGEAAGYNSGYTIGAKEGAEVGYAKGEQEGYNKGVAEYWWVPYMQSLFGMFSNITFPENTEIMLKMPEFACRMDSAFSSAKNLKKITLVCENWKGHVYGVYAPSAFSTISSSLEVIDLSNFKVIYGSVNHIFSNNSGLREIIGELDFSLSTNNSAITHGCGQLEEIRFVAGCLKTSANFRSCGKLSTASIQSIVDGLADLTGAATQTLSVHKDVGAKLTPEQKADITAKNWTLVY